MPAFLLNTQLLMLAMLPHVTTRAEAEEALPDSDHASFRDRVFEVVCHRSPPILLSAQVAQYIDMRQLAKRYCFGALDFHKNPKAIVHTHLQLGCLMARNHLPSVTKDDEE